MASAIERMFISLIPSIRYVFDASGYNGIKNFNDVKIPKRITIYYLSPDTLKEYRSPAWASHPHHRVRIEYSRSFLRGHSQNAQGKTPVAVNMSLIVSDIPSLKKQLIVPDTLRVLYVDDETVLLDICKLQLERCGISVTTAGSVLEAFAILESTGFDVILSDYQMPVTDGIEFLKILQERECTIPFILFTGKGREEVVIEAIDNGATYYLQKGGDPKSMFAELEHKVKEASRRHKAEEALKETKLRYDILFENSGTAIIILDGDMVISSANTVFSRMTGHEKNEIEGNLRWTDFVPDEDASKLIEQYRLLWQGSYPSMHQIAIRLVTKDRRIRVVSATITMIPDTRWCIASLIDTTAIAFGEEIPVRKRVDPSIPQNGNPQTNVTRKEFLPMMTQAQLMRDICGSDQLFYH